MMQFFPSVLKKEKPKRLNAYASRIRWSNHYEGQVANQANTRSLSYLIAEHFDGYRCRKQFEEQERSV